jgi:hypothetical protein
MLPITEPGNPKPRTSTGLNLSERFVFSIKAVGDSVGRAALMAFKNYKNGA